MDARVDEAMHMRPGAAGMAQAGGGLPAAMPGIAIFIVSMAFNLLGDGLRDVLDPKGAKE